MRTITIVDRSVKYFFRHLLRLALYGSVGVVLTLILVLVMYLDSRPDLAEWHLAELDAEYTTGSDVHSFDEYMALENHLFHQLEERVYARTGPAGDDRLNRYRHGSLADPSRWTPNWNRTFEWPAESPRASVLLLHGLSDSPYSLRAIGQRLHEAGAHVLGLRLPGNGTAPSGLVTARWEDMAAAVRLAVDHLAAPCTSSAIPTGPPWRCTTRSARWMTRTCPVSTGWF